MLNINETFPQPNKPGWPWEPVHHSTSEADFAVNNWPKISIITPSFNQGQFIEETIRSVLLQGYPNLEYIIIDGGSTDQTIDIIRKYEPWLAHWVSEPDRGQSHAINKGIEKATGDWIAWLNTDDIYLPDTFSKIATTVSQSAKPVSWIVGTTIFTDLELHEIDRFKPSLYTAPGRDPNYGPMGWIDFVCTKRSGIALPQPSSFWLRSAVIQAGGIDESLRYAMDHELYGRLAYQGFRPVLLEEPLACFRTHCEQKTANFPIAFWEEELKIVYKWADRVNGMEKEKLENYGIWLDKQIKHYPYRVFYQSTKSRFRNVLKFMFGSIYKRIKKRFNNQAA
ncbi:MAG: glycosyltransferase family 2 protein [Chloroflexota bacterium]